LDRAIDLALAGSQKDFPVVDEGEIKGILTQSDFLTALTASKNQHSSVISAMQSNFVTVDSLNH
jgi:predicted transcriptional regulator